MSNRRVPMCDENCFECKFEDCITNILPKERERQRLYYQKHKEEKKAYSKQYRKRIYERRIKNAE